MFFDVFIYCVANFSIKREIVKFMIFGIKKFDNLVKEYMILMKSEFCFIRNFRC